MQFCHQCGKQTPQVSVKFCPHCGTNLTSLASVAPVEETPQQQFHQERPQRFTVRPPTRRPVGQTPIADDEENDDDPYLHAQSLDVTIDGLDIEIAKPRAFRETIGGLVASGPNDSPDIRTPTKLTKKAQKEQVKALLSEGSALRPETKQRKTVKNG